jgi:hypothetical protein
MGFVGSDLSEPFEFVIQQLIRHDTIRAAAAGFDNLNYTYIGNPGLCGYPLSKNCSTSTTDAEQSVHEVADHIAYLYLGMSIGFGVGLWTVFGTMLLRRTWASAYFQIIDELYDEIYVRVAIAWARLTRETRDDTA